MTYTGPGSLSYEFRKGTMNDTVTIGYHNMENCSSWIKSLDWQDYMFQSIDKGFTVKKAYDRACAEYPQIADYVRFIGDSNLKINHNNTGVSKVCFDTFSEEINSKIIAFKEILYKMHLRNDTAT